jgi:hypothetical protein
VFRGHHARQEGCNRLLSHLLVVPLDMSRHPRHDRGGRDKVAIIATYRGTDKADSSPACRLPEKPSRRSFAYAVMCPDERV